MYLNPICTTKHSTKEMVVKLFGEKALTQVTKAGGNRRKTEPKKLTKQVDRSMIEKAKLSDLDYQYDDNHWLCICYQSLRAHSIKLESTDLGSQKCLQDPI
ncbi:hypothetical protein DI09_42p170 [Mitosporidium daphniae]|uniref:Uncharacterized protein n=1 Tax=Mitosporidium daphniae TaxID=1485682 RepID=A0A098VQR6_9MICR|nr:uncharacterized protein DI09_42p170 [Mitosporidium daphniae]KGG51174.1 hypothetical protein DI09_42p170 [Mitosporidium daphniae]|eukprot:XP_013237601.1 uncharacterized protein DI09_42p170 [Mitosporidium daphniae]